MKFSVQNKSSNKKEFFIIMDIPLIFSLETYFYKENHLIEEKIDRVDESEGLVLPLTLHRGETVDIYMKINNFNLIIIPSKIVTKNELIAYNVRLNLWQGIFFGIIIVMLFFNFILYLITKFKAYLFYIAYLFGMFFYFFILQGYLYQFSLFHNALALTSFGIFSMIFLLFFVHELLNIKKNLPKINKLFRYLIYLSMVINLSIMLCYLMKSYVIAHYFISLFTLLTIPLYLILISYTTYYLAYKGETMAHYFSIVWTVILLAAIFSIVLPYNGAFIYNYSFFNYILQGAFAFEAIMFSIILALRIKEMEAEKEAQREMIIQQNKLVAMGEMLHNIAHQWRQPLSVINAISWKLYIQYEKNELTNEIMEKNIEEVENVTQYLSNTINDFMNFSHPNKKKEHFYIQESVENAINMLNLSKHPMQIKINIDTNDNYSIQGFKSEFIQSLIIILNNAKEAMESNAVENPKINIKIKEKDEKIHLSIHDNGGGIPLEIEDKIYNPYFTTKAKTEGTGLGLYITKMIIENSMNGEIKSYNKASGFYIELIIPMA